MTSVLITGAGGFTGLHLVRYLREKGDQVFGFDQVPVGQPSAPKHEEVGAYHGDIRNRAILKQTLSQARPETIFHLAGILKSDNVQRFYEINVIGTLTLLETVVESSLKPRLLIASSSAVYGWGVGSRPISEQFRLRPVTHYAVSKVAQEAVAGRYCRVHDLPIICTRAFNVIGPGQPPEYACSGFARQIALAEQAGRAGTIMAGNLSSRRDFTDIRDVVRAYDMVAQLGKPGHIYNICTQKAVSIQQCLDVLLGLARVPLEIRVDAARLQAEDVPIQVGSAAKLFDRTGWQPRITLQRSLKDLLEYWRQQVGAI